MKAVLASNPVYVSFKIFYNNRNVKVTNRILAKEVWYIKTLNNTKIQLLLDHSIGSDKQFS